MEAVIHYANEKRSTCHSLFLYFHTYLWPCAFHLPNRILWKLPVFYESGVVRVITLNVLFSAGLQ